MELLRKNTAYENVKEKKIRLRAEFSEKRRQISAEDKKQYDERICKKIMSLAGFRYADEILTYSPLKNEVDITEINALALKMGKTLAFPRCIAGTPNMEFYKVSELSQLEKGAYSIMEPKTTCEKWQPSAKKALCIIPAIAFDKKGYRLGYGKGYYDRFLFGKDFVTLGVAYSRFLVDFALPKGRYDKSVDIIVTDNGCVFVK